MAELGGEPEASVIGLDARAARPERRVRERDALPRPRLRRHALRLGRARQRRSSCPAALAVARGARRERAGAARRDRRRQRGRDARRHGGVRRVPRARLPPDRDLRDLRRDGRGRAASPGSTPADAASALGIAGSMASGLFAYLDDATRDEADASRRGPRTAALLAARLAAHGAEGPPGVLEGRFGVYHAFVGDGGSTSSAQLADLGERWETPRIAFKPYPACHFMPRLARRHRRCSATASTPDEIEEIVVDGARGGRAARARAGGDEARAAHRLRGRSSASSTRPPRCSSTARSTSRRYTRRGDRRPARARARRQGALRDEGVPDAIRRRSRAASGSGCATGGRSRPTLPHQRGAPENPMSEAQVREKFRENAALALDAAASAVSRRRSWRSTTPWRRARRARSPRQAPSRRDGRLAEQREIVATVREFVEREVVPVASELEHADEFPAALVEDDEGARALRRHDPRGVRRARPRPDDLRADRGRALARLDVALGRPQHALHLGAG